MKAPSPTVSRKRISFFRWITLLEGVSLIVLVLVAVPIKYGLGDPSWVRLIGPIHGALFLVFAYLAWDVGNQVKWVWSQMIWKVLIATFIPFGTFYLDHRVLRHL